MKLISDNFDKTLSFETFMGQKYRGLIFTDLLSARTVVDLGFDAAALHRQHLNFNPEGMPDDYTKYKYARFVDAETNVTYLGVPWVRETSIIENSSPDYELILKEPTQDQLDSLRSMVVASGIENFVLQPRLAD